MVKTKASKQVASESSTPRKKVIKPKTKSETKQCETLAGFTVTKVQGVTTWTCKKMGCQMEFTIKGFAKRHKQSGCRLIKRCNKFRSRANVSNTLNLSRALIRGQLGQGGFGQIWEAKIGKMDMVVKIIGRQDSFEQEKNTYLKIHSGTVKKGFPLYYGCLKLKGSWGIFSQKLDIALDQILDHYTQQGKSFQIHTAAKLMKAIVERLEVLHFSGIVHRDLKWNNIMFKGNDVYIIDFGSCVELPKVRVVGSIFGSIKYLSLDAHQFYVQTWKDDLQTIGWMFLGFFTREMPWSPIVHAYNTGEIGYHKASNQIWQCKKLFLERSDKSGMDYPQFAIKYLKYVTKIQFNEHPNQIDYDWIKKMLNSIKQDHVTQTIRWDSFRRKPCVQQQWRPIHGVCFEVKSFDPFMLSPHIIAKYKQKVKLSQVLIITELKRSTFQTNFYQYVDLNARSEWFVSQIKLKSPRLWLVFSNQGNIGPHFSAYISLSGKLMSFNALGKWEPQILKQFKIQHWRCIGFQNDGWSCGYRAMFWILQVFNFGGAKEWLNAKQIDL